MEARMRYLIDGYNLMYALGLVRRNGGRAGWERARRTMLDWLADQVGNAVGDTTVIFDAQNTVGGVVEEAYRGLHLIRDRGRTADDLIEDLLKEERTPQSLTVVSNDARVREAAKRRGGQVLKCSEYVDQLMRSPKRPASATSEDEKDAQATPEEKARWLKAFGK
jgi:predicted RNA-binding protein with PIN domain